MKQTLRSIWKPDICSSSTHWLWWTTRSTSNNVLKHNERKISTSSPAKSAAAATQAQPAILQNETVLAEYTRLPVERISGRIKPPTARNSTTLEHKLVGCNGAEIFCEMLRRHDVQQLFGCTGRAPIPIFNEILQSENCGIIYPKHEQGAGHMAEGYSRVTGKPGVVLVASDSAATNLTTPMQDALCDGTPMVVFSAEVSINGLEMEAFREADIIGISKFCTKWNITVRSVEELPQRINEAFEIATSGRPGPVLVNIPRHIAASILQNPAPFNTLYTRRLSPVTAAPWARPVQSLDETLDRVARLINMAKKPILYVGQGMLAQSQGPRLLKELADKALIPVTTSLQGLGVFDELDPKSLHMLGTFGAAYANLAIQGADTIIALGARFDDRVTGNISKFAPQALLAARENRGGIIHFDIAPKNINKVVDVVEAVQGDCATNLMQLIPRINHITDRPEWFSEINKWKSRFPLTAYNRLPTSPTPGLIRAQAVIEKLSDMTAHMKDRTIVSTGVGQHQMWAAHHFRWRYPRTMITSGGLGTMGYGLPAAIGAKTARPDCLVIDIDGDASFNMTMNELSTAAQYNIAVKVLLFNNEQMGMISDIQRLYYDQRFAHNRQSNPDFVRASEAFGVAADRCSVPADIEAKLQWLLNYDGPAVLEVITEQASSVWPVVPSGSGLHEFITYDETTSSLSTPSV